MPFDIDRRRYLIDPETLFLILYLIGNSSKNLKLLNGQHLYYIYYIFYYLLYTLLYVIYKLKINKKKYIVIN